VNASRNAKSSNRSVHAKAAAARSKLKKRLAAVTASAIAGVSLGAAPAALAESYTYDAQGRLTSVTSDGGVVTYYCYDSAGNRTHIGPTPC
jgi:YD repeat-containing protein